jgi:uncharacterized protein (TIGR02145 family)
MKTKIFFPVLLIALAMGGCSDYDDSALWNEVNDLKTRLTALETKVNNNILALQGITAAMENNDYVTGVETITGGYIVHFFNFGDVTITNGTDGVKGDNGAAAPQIGIAQFPANSGTYYWTLGGEFITDDGTPTGNKFPVTGSGSGEKGDKGDDGAPGIPPKVAIGSDNYWYICSTGTCADWSAGNWAADGWQATDVKATGNNGSQGDAIFAGVDYYDNDSKDYVEFTLADNVTTIQVPKYRQLGISFTPPDTFNPGEVKLVGYTLTGIVEYVKVVNVPQGWTIAVTKIDNAGTFTITAPAAFPVGGATVEEAVILVSDGAERTMMRPLPLPAGVNIFELDIATISATSTADGYPINITSNMVWTAAVNSEATSWVSLTNPSGTGNGVITVNIADNITTTGRAATVTVTAGALAETVAITQAPATAGSTFTFTDPRDSKQYKVVVMSDNKIWFADNLRYTQGLTWNQLSKNANGVEFTTAGNGAAAIGSYWCPGVAGAASAPNENSCNVYGALYTWETAMMVDGKWADDAKTNSDWDDTWLTGKYFSSTSDAPGTAANAVVNNARSGRGICPTGWHVPTEREWALMLDAINGTTDFTTQAASSGTDEGIKLKSDATYTGADPGDGAWADHDNRGTNATGFDAVPAGNRTSNGSSYSYRGQYAFFWSASPTNSGYAWRRTLINTSAGVTRTIAERSCGYAVRCVKD